jgi:hypothetical protein
MQEFAVTLGAMINTGSQLNSIDRRSIRDQDSLAFMGC